MKVSPFFVLLASALVLSLLAASPGQAASTAMPAASPLDEVWLLPGKAYPTKRVQVGVVAKEFAHAEGVAVAFPAFPASAPVPVECVISSEGLYRNTLVRLQLFDAQQQPVAETQLEIQINKGTSNCTFHLDLSRLSPGSYQVAVEADYTDEDDHARYVFPLRKVRPELLQAQAATLVQAVDEMASHLPAQPPAQASLPYERVRLSLARHFLAEAHADGEAGTWQVMDYKLRYVEAALEEIRSGITFSGLRPELANPLPPLNFAAATLQDAGWVSNGQPVYFTGVAYDRPEAARVRNLSELGLNLAALYLPPPAPPAAVGMASPNYPEVAATITAAGESNVGVVVEISPMGSGPAAEPGWPKVENEDFLDLSLAVTRDQVSAHAQQLLPQLQQYQNVLAVSLAQMPRFKFRGDAVREAFMARVRQLYPERSDLNQAWRAHLASYDEIKLWAAPPDLAPQEGDSPAFDPLSSYQGRRPYTYDWTNFHQELITSYFSYLSGTAKAAAPRIPLTAALDANAFEKGETQYAANREDVEKLMDISGVTVGVEQSDKFYAFNYPRQSAVYALLRSFNPMRPVINLNNDVALEPVLDAGYYYRLLHALTWEGAVSGVNASAIPATSGIWKHPRAVEGLATGSLDLNRLSRVVHALQVAPVEVGVLFSESSKILDQGAPHLQSAIYAYEGCSFSGYHVRFISEDQVAAGVLDQLLILVIPETPAVRDATFDKLYEYVQRGGTVARVGTPIPYNEYGISRRAVLRNTGNTVLVRGINLPTEYLHAMDAAIVLGTLPAIPRAVNSSGYPIEGVKSRHVEVDGVPYLYLVNLRQNPVRVQLAGNVHRGRDLVQGRDVQFPMELDPLEVMLIRMDSTVHEATLVAENGNSGGR